MKTFRIMVIGIIALGLVCGTAFAAAPVAKKQVVKIQPAPVSTQTAPGGQAPPSGKLKALKPAYLTSRIEGKDATAVFGKPITLKAQFWDQNGVLRPGKKLIVEMIGPQKTYEPALTNSAGIATVVAGDGELPGGTYAVQWRFDGDAQAQPASGRGNLTITKARTKLQAGVKTVKEHGYPRDPTVLVVFGNLDEDPFGQVRQIKCRPNCLVKVTRLDLVSQQGVSMDNVKIGVVLGDDNFFSVHYPWHSMADWKKPAPPPEHYVFTVEFEGSGGYLPSKITIRK